MKILHTEASAGWGGQDIRVIVEIQEMRRRGHEVTLACTPDSPIWKAAEKAGLALEPITFGRKLTWSGVRTIRQLIHKHQPEIVNSHSSADGWCAAVAVRLSRRDGLPRHVRTRHLSNPLKPNRANFLLYSKLTDYTLVTGEALRQDLIKINGLNPDRILSVPTGVDLSKFDPANYDRADFRQEIGAAPEDFVWALVAIIRRMKGHLVLAEAAVEVLKAHPKARFVFVGGITGPSPLPEQVKAKLKEYGIEDRFTFLGMREDVPRILAGCDAAVLPSTHGEGVPQSLAQALSMGLPAVASNVGAIGEIVRDGAAYAGQETGYLVPPSDSKALAAALNRVMADPEETSRRTARGRDLIHREYSLQAMTDKVEGVYRQLLDEVRR
jgi:glycosyltransferase involved in cell wall biosynthesis